MIVAFAASTENRRRRVAKKIVKKAIRRVRRRLARIKEKRKKRKTKTKKKIETTTLTTKTNKTKTSRPKPIWPSKGQSIVVARPLSTNSLCKSRRTNTREEETFYDAIDPDYELFPLTKAIRSKTKYVDDFVLVLVCRVFVVLVLSGALIRLTCGSCLSGGNANERKEFNDFHPE